MKQLILILSFVLIFATLISCKRDSSSSSSSSGSSRSSSSDSDSDSNKILHHKKNKSKGYHGNNAAYVPLGQPSPYPYPYGGNYYPPVLPPYNPQFGYLYGFPQIQTPYPNAADSQNTIDHSLKVKKEYTENGHIHNSTNENESA